MVSPELVEETFSLHVSLLLTPLFLSSVSNSERIHGSTQDCGKVCNRGSEDYSLDSIPGNNGTDKCQFFRLISQLHNLSHYLLS